MSAPQLIYERKKAAYDKQVRKQNEIRRQAARARTEQARIVRTLQGGLQHWNDLHRNTLQRERESGIKYFTWSYARLYAKYHDKVGYRRAARGRTQYLWKRNGRFGSVLTPSEWHGYNVYQQMKRIQQRLPELTKKIQAAQNLPPLTAPTPPPAPTPTPTPAPRGGSAGTADRLRKELEKRYQTGNREAQRLTQNLQRLAATNPMTITAARLITDAAQRASDFLVKQAKGQVLVNKNHLAALRLAIVQALNQRSRVPSGPVPAVEVPAEPAPSTSPPSTNPLSEFGSILQTDLEGVGRIFAGEIAKQLDHLFNPTEQEIYEQLKRMQAAQKRLAAEGAA